MLQCTIIIFIQKFSGLIFSELNASVGGDMCYSKN